MQLATRILSAAILIALASTAGAASKKAVNPYAPAEKVLQQIKAKVHGSGSDVVLPEGWVDVTDGYQHYRYTRIYNSLPVRGGDFVIVMDGDRLVEISQTFTGTLDVDTTHPALRPDDAVVAAGAAYNGTFVGVPTANLVILTGPNNSARLAYEVDLVTSTEKDVNGEAIHVVYSIDAQTGAVLQYFKSTGYVVEEGTSAPPYWASAVTDACDGAEVPGVKDSVEHFYHKSTHWSTDGTTRFTNTGESGALLEATADIYGTFNEFAADTATSLTLQTDSWDYMIGENLFSDAPPYNQALRWMFDPKRDGHSPSCYVDNVGSLDTHYGAGPAEHFFYLLAEGTASKMFSGVDHTSTTCNGTSLSGIGIREAAAIWGTAAGGYMTSHTDYAGARIATLHAAAELYGANSPEVTAVDAAWAAVNVH